MEIQRLGIIADKRKEKWYQNIFGEDFLITYVAEKPTSYAEALDKFSITNIQVAIIDDEWLLGDFVNENEIVEWHTRGTALVDQGMRIVIYSNSVRDSCDPWFYQLVSKADIKDIVYEGYHPFPDKELRKIIDKPYQLQHVEFWKTSDPDLLAPRVDKKGLSGIMHNRKLKKERARIEEHYAKILEAKKETNDVQGSSAEIDRDEATASREEERTQHPEKTQEQERQALSSANAKIVSEYERAKDKTEAPAQPKEQNKPTSTQKKKAVEGPKEDPTEPSKDDKPIDILKLIGAQNQPEEPLSTPSAKTIISIGGIRHGIGVTQLTILIGLELGRRGMNASVALNDRKTYNAIMTALEGTAEVNEVGFRYDGCDFYHWPDQRKLKKRYDFVACDCGVIDLYDTSQNSPSTLFNRSTHSIYILGGSLWDLGLLEEQLSRFDTDAMKKWKFAIHGAQTQMIDNLSSTLSDVFRSEDFKVFDIPYTPDALFNHQGASSAYGEIFDKLTPARK